jgi:hypothetical protein
MASASVEWSVVLVQIQLIAVGVQIYHLSSQLRRVLDKLSAPQSSEPLGKKAADTEVVETEARPLEGSQEAKRPLHP